MVAFPPFHDLSSQIRNSLCYVIRCKVKDEPEQVTSYYTLDAALADFKVLQNFPYYEYCVIEQK